MDSDGPTTDDALTNIPISRSAAQARNYSRLIWWTEFGLCMLHLRINRKTCYDALAAGACDDPSLRRHRNRLGEVAAKAKARYSLIISALCQKVRTEHLTLVF
jgi:hypothetical protein